MIVTDEIKRVLAEIKADPVANELMVGKCNWEQMTRSAVLLEWGDPRTWPAYQERLQENKPKEVNK